MTNYSLPSIIFIIFHFISIMSIILLILVLLKSPSYSTKWTIFQLCLAVLGNSIFSVLTILKYGDDILEALDKPICIIQQKLSNLFFYPLYLFPCVLAFYLWSGTVNSNSEVENKHFWTFTLLIWGFSFIYSSTILTVSRFEDNWGVVATNLSCEGTYSFRSKRYLDWLFQGITLAIASISLFFTIRSTMIIWQRWKVHKKNPNRKTANELDHAVRMIVYVCLYCIIVCFYLILEIMQQIKSDEKSKHYYYIGKFNSSLFGIYIFLIFGTKKSTILLLPCCYYYRNLDDDETSNYLDTATNTKIKRISRDTVVSEAITIEVLTESDADNDRFSATFSENQKRIKRHSLQDSTKGKRSSKSRRRHSDSSYERERRHNGHRRRDDRRHNDRLHSSRRHNSDSRHNDVTNRRVVSNVAENSRRLYFIDLENENTDNNNSSNSSSSSNNGKNVVNNGGSFSSEHDLQRIWRQF